MSGKEKRAEARREKRKAEKNAYLNREGKKNAGMDLPNAGMQYDDRIPEILNEAFLYVATVMLKKHAEEILKIQEMYFDQTRKVNDKTIEILKSLITKEK